MGIIKTIVICPIETIYKDAKAFYSDDDTTMAVLIPSTQHTSKVLHGVTFDKVIILADEIFYRIFGVLGYDNMIRTINTRNPAVKYLRTR